VTRVRVLRKQHGVPNAPIDVASLTGTPGVTWDLIDVSGGVLDLSGLSSGGQFTLDLTTLGGDDLPGPLQTAYTGGNLTFAIASFSSLSVPGGFSTAAGSDLTELSSLMSGSSAHSQPRK